MKIKSIKSVAPKAEKIEAQKVDLSKLGELINVLNEAIAPSISDDLKKDKDRLEEKRNEVKEKITDLQELNNKISELKKTKNDLLKKMKVVSLLANMHANFVINQNIKNETISILNNLNTFTSKRLNLQIEKLSKILNIK